jgi:hypothetical protein
MSLAFFLGRTLQQGTRFVREVIQVEIKMVKDSSATTVKDEMVVCRGCKPSLGLQRLCKLTSF